MAREKVKQVQVFSLPTEYERQAAEARRREMMAEMLAQQAYDPGQYQGAPIPKAAPVVKALEGYLRGREMRKAREAGEKAEAEVSRAGQQIMGRLMGGAPIAEPVMPDASGLDEVRVQSQYRASPDDAMRMAMTPVGSAAMRGNPALAAMLAKTMERPEAEEFYAPIETEGGLVQFGKRGGRKDTGVQAAPEEMTPYQKEQIRIEEERLAFQRSKAGQAEGRAKAPSGYRYNETGELEPIPGGPQDPNRPMTMPLAARNNIITEQDNSRQFAIASQRTNKFINDIQSGKLPLYKGASVVYAAERALDRNKSYSEENRPPYDRYYELDRFVTEQVNMILSRAKLTKTRCAPANRYWTILTTNKL
jgi:hypothetical protein